ncbi:hypothetical protein GALMADRAFT_211672 [Galerina marginata CBS 339.88]|uniref:Uncharacterized protein n=1 Tax=Galerina marginata (strain CBS 339.88) TaxID=685588 RepID=A0A067SX84_GALM3|nr:hypothetical protein GALMADRAFT_211672 [Galerina marginata CBS 339.88]
MSPPTSFWFSLKHKIPSHLDEKIYAICISPDGRQILTGGSSGEVKIWDALSGRLFQSLNIGAEVTALSWASISWRQDAFWSLFCSPFCLAFKAFVSGPVESISSYKRLIAVAGGQDLQLWEVRSHGVGIKGNSVVFSLSTLPQTPSGPREPNHTLREIPFSLPQPLLDQKRLHAIHLLPDHDMVLLSFVDSHPSGQKSILALYFLKPWKLVRSVEIDRRIGLAAISNDRLTFAFTNLRDAGEYGSVCVYQTITRTLVYRLQGPSSVVAAGSGNGTVMTWSWNEVG